MSAASDEPPQAPGRPPAPRRILFDTNIMLDVLLARPGLLRESAELWEAADSRRIQGFVTATAVTTVAYLVQRAYTAERAREDVRAVLATFEVAQVGRIELAGALEGGFADYEDGVVHEAARTSRCEAIVTRNGRDFKASQVPIYTPAELLSALSISGDL